MIYTTEQRQFMIWHITGKRENVSGALLIADFEARKKRRYLNKLIEIFLK